MPHSTRVGTKLYLVVLGTSKENQHSFAGSLVAPITEARANRVPGIPDSASALSSHQRIAGSGLSTTLMQLSVAELLEAMAPTRNFVKTGSPDER